MRDSPQDDCRVRLPSGRGRDMLLSETFDFPLYASFTFRSQPHHSRLSELRLNAALFTTIAQERDMIADFLRENYPRPLLARTHAARVKIVIDVLGAGGVSAFREMRRFVVIFNAEYEFGPHLVHGVLGQCGAIFGYDDPDLVVVVHLLD